MLGEHSGVPRERSGNAQGTLRVCPGYAQGMLSEHDPNSHRVLRALTALSERIPFKRITWPLPLYCFSTCGDVVLWNYY